MTGAVGFSRSDLERIAQQSDLELSSSSDGQSVDTQTGWWGGRLARDLKAVVGTERSERSEGYIGAKKQVLDSLKAIYGDEIGQKAFRAGIGISDGHGGWMSSSRHPITGRHVRAMLKVAKAEMAQQHDVLRMRQISVGGMAGPFSKGVCNAATRDWFRRIDQGLPTWAHSRDKGSKGLDPSEREVVTRSSVDWEKKRDRLQQMQSSHTSRDARFGDLDYSRGMPLASGVIGSPTDLHGFADEVADGIERHLAGLDDSDDSGDEAPDAGHQFFQLDIVIKGRVYGQIGHTIGIHVDPSRDEVHVFDANQREAIVPKEEFATWLQAHLETRYGDRVTMGQLSAVERHGEAGGPSPKTGEGSPSSDVLTFDDEFG